MKHNNAMNLLALACVAVRQGEPEDAGALLATAMQQDDADDCISELLASNETIVGLSASLAPATIDYEGETLASIASSITTGIDSAFRDSFHANLKEAIEQSEMSDFAEDEEDEDENEVDSIVMDEDDDSEDVSSPVKIA